MPRKVKTVQQIPKILTILSGSRATINDDYLRGKIQVIKEESEIRGDDDDSSDGRRSKKSKHKDEMSMMSSDEDDSSIDGGGEDEEERMY